MAPFEKTILTTAYFPPVEYFLAIAQGGKVVIEQHEQYQKQSYRNRCRIFSTGGPESLSIPVVKEGDHSRPIRDIRIDYSEPWLQHHTRAFDAAYNSSAFYEYYADDLLAILRKKPEFLFDLNMELLETLLTLVGLKAEISFSDSFEKEYPEGVLDGRFRIQPKYKGESLLSEHKKEKTYFQVFSNKFSFVPNLSIIDLLSAEGPGSIDYIL